MGARVGAIGAEQLDKGGEELPTLFRKFYSYMASETTIRRILSGKSNDSKVCRGAFMQYRHVLETLSNSVLHHSAQSQKTLYPLRLCSRPRMLTSSLLPISLCYKQIDNLPSAGWLPLIRNVRYSKAYKIYLYTPCGHTPPLSSSPQPNVQCLYFLIPCDFSSRRHYNSNCFQNFWMTFFSSKYYSIQFVEEFFWILDW